MLMAESSRTTDRHKWLVRRFMLGSQPGDDLSAETTPEQRLEMMWPLAVEAWTLTGAALPNYTRRHTPVRAVPAAPPSRVHKT